MCVKNNYFLIEINKYTLKFKKIFFIYDKYKLGIIKLILNKIM